MGQEEMQTETDAEEAVDGFAPDEKEAAEFADKIAGEAGLNEPDEAEQEAEQAQAEQEAAMNEQGSQLAAMMMIETVEQTLKGVVHPRFTFEPGVKETAIEKYTPLIIKYGPKAMILFGQWQDEIAAGMFTATLVMQSAKQVKQLKAEDKAAVKAAAEAAKAAETKGDDDAAEATE